MKPRAHRLRPRSRGPHPTGSQWEGPSCDPSPTEAQGVQEAVGIQLPWASGLHTPWAGLAQSLECGQPGLEANGLAFSQAPACFLAGPAGGCVHSRCHRSSGGQGHRSPKVGRGDTVAGAGSVRQRTEWTLPGCGVELGTVLKLEPQFPI